MKFWQKGIILGSIPGFFTSILLLVLFLTQSDRSIFVGFMSFVSWCLSPVPAYFILGIDPMELHPLVGLAIRFSYWIILGLFFSFLYEKLKTHWVAKTIFLAILIPLLLVHFVFSFYIILVTVYGG